MKGVSKWALPVFIGLLVLIGVGASVSFYFRPHPNEGFADYPAITALHVILGGLYMALAPFQFIPRIRKNRIGYHRRAGRVLVGIGVIVGLTAAFMAIVFPYSGWPERLIVTPFTIYFSVAIYLGYRHVRGKNIRLHQEWMIRAFAVGLAISTQRILFLPPLFYIIFRTGEPTESELTFLTVLSFTLALVLHSIFAEIWIRRGRTNKSKRLKPA